MTTKPTQPAATPNRTRPAYETRSTRSRMRMNSSFRYLCLGATLLAIVILLTLLITIFAQGVGGLSIGFLTRGNSSQPQEAGVRISLVGSLMLVIICAVSAVPLGVGTALLIEEFKPRNKWLLGLHGVIETNIRNLAGVPSIVYGILGVGAFATMFGVFGPMGQSDVSIGQRWYDKYTTEAGVSYFVPRSGSLQKDPGVAAASEKMTFYTSKSLDEVAQPFTWITQEDVEPIREKIKGEMQAFEDKFIELVKANKVGRKLAIDRAEAQAITDGAIAAGTWQNDPSVFRDELVEIVAGLDGLSTLKMIGPRDKAINMAVDLEYATRVPNTMMAGSLPIRVDHKTWYHVALPMGRGVLAGGLTLMLVILPIVIVASQEALRAVPESYRQGALALGATKWQAISKTALPAAIPGICTGTILAISRAIGEAAPILAIGAAGYVTTVPENLMGAFSALPVNIFFWSGENKHAFQNVAASGIIVLLAVLLCFNAIAIYIRQRSSKHQ